MADSEPAEGYVLRIYNANRTEETVALAGRFKDALKTYAGGESVVEAVDVLSSPERAAIDKIFATPTIVKESPEPVRRVIGDLSDIHWVLVALGIAVETKRED